MNDTFRTSGTASLRRRDRLQRFTFAALVALGVLLPAVAGPPAMKYPADFRFVPVPDALAEVNPRLAHAELAVPKPGVTFRDPVFGTLLTRVTTASIRNGRHEYSRFDPFNADGSLVILGPESRGIFSTRHVPYNGRPPVMLLGDFDEPRWDPNDPNRLWFTRGKALYTLDVRSRKETHVRDFGREPALRAAMADRRVWRITMKDEGEASRDLRYWAFAIQGGESAGYKMLHLFTWDRTSGRILGQCALKPEEREIDWVGVSPLGTWVLIGGLDNNRGRMRGLTMANLELTRFHPLDHTTAHADVALDLAGREVLVMQNTRTDTIDLIPLSWETRATPEGGGHEGTGRIPLVRLFYSGDSPHRLVSGIHISGNHAGYVVISTVLELEPRGRSWLDNCIILVRLDALHPRAVYLAQVVSERKDYWEETQASITRDGRAVVWATNFGRHPGKQEVSLMRLDMPPDWHSLIR